MKGLEIPEEIDVWGELSPKVRRDLVALSRIRRQSIKRILVESILVSIEGLTGGELSREGDYKEEFDELKLLEKD